MSAAADRLSELVAEREHGQRQLEVLEARRRELRDTLLRIDGAIQVLDELAAAAEREVADIAEAAV